ncbi:MAG: MFS transporter [Pseudomonadota bacterium]
MAVADGGKAGGNLAAATSVYLGGLVIGLTLVSFPASSLVLRSIHGFSNEAYGAIYLPQLIAAVGGALAGGAAEGRVSLKAMYIVSLLAFCLAETLLAMSASASTGAALPMVMAATALFGFGFGFGGGPLNAFAALLFPSRQGAAVTALHMCAGAGLTLAPILFAALDRVGLWIAGPVALAATAGLLALLSIRAPLPVPPQQEVRTTSVSHPSRSLFFWLCAAAAMFYSIAEGTFSNWAIVFLTDERGLDPQAAALALTCFWAALTAGRLLATLIAGWLPPAAFLLSLPLAIMLTQLALPMVGSPAEALIGFAAAGLSCSAFFPMLVAFAAAPTPQAISWIASMLTAAMMVGVGIGSYAIGALRGSKPIAALYPQSTLAPALCLIATLAAFVMIRRRRSPA